MENINQYLEIVKREKKNKAKYDKNLNDYLRNQQNKYAERLNPIMSQIYNMLLEIHKSIQDGVKTNNSAVKLSPQNFMVFLETK
ncbi:MAG: hypothetical protein WCF59_04420 [Desulfobaccales bacterium]